MYLSSIELVYALLATGGGGYFFNKIIFESKIKSVFAWVIYIFLLASIIFWVSLLTACGKWRLLIVFK